MCSGRAASADRPSPCGSDAGCLTKLPCEPTNIFGKCLGLLHRFYAHGPELAIDLDHPRVGAEGGKPLFTEHGQPTRYLQSIIWALQDLKPGVEMVKVFIARLLELKLIEPIDVEVEFDDGTMRNCVGLYTINQEVLARLSDEIAVELFRRGYMRLIHLMIASLKQIPVLARKKNSRLLRATEGLAGARAPALG